jgi:uncharacterized protein (DUF885 family)
MGAIQELADAYVERYAELDPIFATAYGLPGFDERLTDYSPDGIAARADVARAALAQLSELTASPTDGDGDRLCASLLRDRLETALAVDEAGEHLRPLRIIGSPVSSIRSVFDLMPRATDDDWTTIGHRLDAVPAAYEGVASALRAGVACHLFAAPRQALACADQLATWAGEHGAPWFVTYVSDAPDTQRAALEQSASTAATAQGDLARYLRDEYASAAADQPDAVGRDRYRLAARQFLGADLDVDDAYEWGWAELGRIEAEMATVADAVLPGAGTRAAMDHLEAEGEAVEGEEALARWLQDLMDSTIAALDGTHFDLAPPLRVVEAMIAPPGTAAAQYYTAPTVDFSRPGRTWYPTMGRTRFPLWGEWSTCYHEGVPGHHLQLAQWRYVAGRLSRFQVASSISGNVEGWALYAERLMDELGYLDQPDRRLGYLVAQQLRAMRVVVDIGMHCEMPVPDGEAVQPGERWTPERGRRFILDHGGRDASFLESEFVRYLGMPGQAICYKLGERVWLAGREAARAAHAAEGDAFDLKAWHMAALSQGALGLDDLASELARL